MPQLTIVTDSTTDIPSDLAEDLDILVAPAWVIIKGREYRDKIDLSSEEFYRRLPIRCRDVYILDNIGPTAGTHMGPGALGVGFYKV
jgi:fatty acid-binding protein DegV